MTTLLETSAGRIVLRDTNGDTVFDTNEKLFTVTDTLSSSITIPQRQASSYDNSFVTTYNIDSDNYLGACNASADTVRGAFSASASTAQGLVGLGWFNASGSYVHYNDTDGVQYNMMVLTFKCSGGGVYLNERTVLKAQPPGVPVTATATIYALTLTYKLFCGAWV